MGHPLNAERISGPSSALKDEFLLRHRRIGKGVLHKPICRPHYLSERDVRRLGGNQDGSELSPFSGDPTRLSHDLANRLRPFDADQLLVETAIEVRQTVGVESELAQDRGVQMFDVERL